MYGSGDCQKTVHADVEEINEMMRKCGELLNLKGKEPDLLHSS